MSKALVVDGIDLSRPEPGRLLPPRAFISPEVFELEQRAIFARSWVHVGDLVDVAEPGDYVTASIGRTPLFLVRGRDGELRGFLNACRHRGTTLLEGRGRCGPQIKCPYHAWSYGTDGRLLGVPYRKEFLCDLGERNLLPVRIDTLGPMVFACLDPEAPPLSVWTGELPAALERAGAGSWTLAYEESWELEANWKLFVENANDGYHVQFVHDILTDLVQLTEAETVTEPHGAYTYARINPDYQLPGANPTTLDPGEARIRFGHLFPNLIPVLTPLDFSYLRVDPLGPQRLRVLARSFDGEPESSPIREFRRQAFVRTTEQDIEVVRRTQEGMFAEGLPPGVHSEQLEARIAHFEHLVADSLATYLERRAERETGAARDDRRLPAFSP